MHDEQLERSVQEEPDTLVDRDVNNTLNVHTNKHSRVIMAVAIGLGKSREV
jgi:hypothetical protein